MKPRTIEPLGLRDSEPSRKRFEDLRAVLALKGFCLYRLDTGGYLIARHNLVSNADDLDAVESFLGRGLAP